MASELESCVHVTDHSHSKTTSAYRARLPGCGQASTPTRLRLSAEGKRIAYWVPPKPGGLAFGTKPEDQLAWPSRKDGIIMVPPNDGECFWHASCMRFSGLSLSAEGMGTSRVP